MMNYLKEGDLILVKAKCFNSIWSGEKEDKVCIFLSERITKWSSDYILYKVIFSKDNKVLIEELFIPLHNLKNLVHKC